MSAEFTNIILFLIFEFFVFFTSLRLIYIINKNQENKSEAELVISWISISLILTSIIPTIFSFSNSSGILQYVIFSALIFLSVHVNKKSEIVCYKQYLFQTFQNIFAKLIEWKVLIIFIAILPVILITIQPTSDPDDLNVLNFIFEWMFNEKNPYHRPYNYVPFWEISFLPSMVISNSDNFLWLNSFKTLLIICLGTYLIGKKINLPEFLIWISVFSSILYFKFWFYTVTMGTLKNDFIFAAGLILIIISLLRYTKVKPDRLCNIFFIVGTIFLTTKFSGLLLSSIAIIIFIFLNYRNILNNKKNTMIWVMVFGIVLLFTTGHYYLNNTIEFGSPIFPIKIGILGFDLPGDKDYSQSSILANIQDGELLTKIFPSTAFTYGGLLFPIFVIFGFVGSLSIVVFSLAKYVKNKKIDLNITVISIFIAFTWFQYVITPFSAGRPEGGLYYLRHLESTRYIFGTIFVTELLFTIVLWKLKIPKKIIFSFIGINLISRYWILVRELPDYANYLIIVIPIAIAIGLYFFGKYIHNFYPRITLLTILLVSIFIFSPYIVEMNREVWVPAWHNVALSVFELPSSEIYLIAEPNRTNELMIRTYPLYGNHFQHSLEIGSTNNLIDILQSEDINKKPQFIIKLCKPLFNCKSELNEFELEFSQYNYELITKDSDAILLKYRNK